MTFDQNMVDIPPIKGMEKTIDPVGLPSWHDEYIGDTPVMDTGALAPLFDTQPEETP
jgi:hypothetical protein